MVLLFIEYKFKTTHIIAKKMAIPFQKCEIKVGVVFVGLSSPYTGKQYYVFWFECEWMLSILKI